MIERTGSRGWWRAAANGAFLAMCAAFALPASAQDAQLQGTAEKGQLIDLKTAPEVPAAPRSRKKKKAAELSNLEFRTDVSEEELEKESKHYESELWKDL